MSTNANFASNNLETMAVIKIHGSDWQADAGQITKITTSIPLTIAVNIFSCFNQWIDECKNRWDEGNEETEDSFLDFCKKNLDEGDYEKLQAYTENLASLEPNAYDLREFFESYCVKKRYRYIVDDTYVSESAFDARCGAGFWHWGEELILLDKKGNVMDEIVLSEG